MVAVELIVFLFAVSVNILSSYHPASVTVTAGGREDTLTAYGNQVFVNRKAMERYENSISGFSLRWDSKVRSYAGSLEVMAEDGELVLVNEVTEGDYLASVVGAEMVPGAKIPALAAQAVLCRTFMETASRHQNEAWDFCDLTHCQSYKGLETTTSATSQAVNETEGLYLMYNGELCEVYYHSTSGGKTADASSIWPDMNHPYLISVPDPYCKASPHCRWEYVVSAEELAQALGFPNVKDLRVVEYATDGRAEFIAIKVNEEGLLMGGWEFRMEVCQALGWNTLRSSWFEVERDAGSFLFKGKGLGHGVGLSQWGAKGMADEGKTFTEILAHYFPGAEVKKW
ncbi:SpoIID/LytB domain-containing protein [candidate division WOR-3 bacterium]|nr:SpoIID/LytB domain-containing protein [candidate division WOR-3 bacterium]